MYFEELTAQALEIKKDHPNMSPCLLMRKLKISSKHATKVCNEILQHEAIMRFRNRRDNLISID